MVASFLFLLNLFIVPQIQAFRCYVCDSKNDIECMENLPTNSRLISQDCKNITGAKFCIKTTNIYAGEFIHVITVVISDTPQNNRNFIKLTDSNLSGELGTKRFCAANDHGNYCKYIRQPTGDREYRSCIYTCDSENCNSAKWILNSLTMLYIVTPITVLTYFVLIKSSY